MNDAALPELGPDVAVIGMAGRFPGAPGTESLWELVRAGKSGVPLLTEEDRREAGVPEALWNDPHYVPARGKVAGVELFDAAFFGFTTREAQVTDPQQRLFLECCWEALEAAGYAPRAVPGRVGVFAGASSSSYLALLLGRPELLAAAGDVQVSIGNDPDFLATRVSYKLDLKGPSMTVQTACSTSLVAVHLACQSLLQHECDVALAGGVSIRLPQGAGYLHQPGGISSPDGRCRPFDAAAAGTVPGNGVGVVALKRLAEALRDGDLVRAVIRGSAVNNDGAAKVGFTAPGVDGQAQAIAEALAVADLTARDVTYVEAHGTGTALGDPVEVEALCRVFRKAGAGRGTCALGAVKSNLGHLDAAAGIAGLIKTVLALEHGVLPPTLHFQRPNPHLDLDAGPFFVPAQAQPWTTGGAPRRAGVSSFGIGGTNAHVILEQAPPRASVPQE